MERECDIFDIAVIILPNIEVYIPAMSIYQTRLTSQNHARSCFFFLILCIFQFDSIYVKKHCTPFFISLSRLRIKNVSRNLNIVPAHHASRELLDSNPLQRYCDRECQPAFLCSQNIEIPRPSSTDPRLASMAH